MVRCASQHRLWIDAFSMSLKVEFMEDFGSGLIYDASFFAILLVSWSDGLSFEKVKGLKQDSNMHEHLKFPICPSDKRLNVANTALFPRDSGTDPEILFR
ncbi:hypothetical protein L1887_11719 [Cichorium endivia]|nr:hypothetical protein L1887_11719 [Cichorium endivia]